jgi:hypothetical protein
LIKFLATVERKVKAAALGALGASLLLALLNAVVGNSELLGGFPPWLQFLLITCGPTLVTALSGYAARHTSIPPASASGIVATMAARAAKRTAP